MSQENTLSRYEAFVAIFSHVTVAINSAVKLAQHIEDSATWALHYCRGTGEEPELDNTWPDVAPLLAEAKAAVNNPALAEIEEGCCGESLCDLRVAVSYIEAGLPEPGASGGYVRYLAEAVDHIVDSAGKLKEYREKLGIAIFGVWGNYWFSVAADNLPSDLVFWDVENEGRSLSQLRQLAEQPEEYESDLTVALDDRNRWLYEQAMAGVVWPEIIKRLKAKPSRWPRISSVPGVKDAVYAYARSHGLPEPPPRSPGRPKGS